MRPEHQKARFRRHARGQFPSGSRASSKVIMSAREPTGPARRPLRTGSLHNTENMVPAWRKLAAAAALDATDKQGPTRPGELNWSRRLRCRAGRALTLQRFFRQARTPSIYALRWG